MQEQANKENPLQEKREDGIEFAEEILSKLNPDQKRRALDILAGFALQAERTA